MHIKYRPDIDGLRAVAVLSVVLFHGFPTRLPGGFVGVDIFFVISGFLITSIIRNQIDDQTFSLTDFYGRRIRRIFPSLFLVMAASYLIGWLVLFSNEFAQLGKHIAGGAWFSSNLVLWSESGYFDTSSETKPLLHLWSLGIEEQFYLFWPVLIALFQSKRSRMLTFTIFILLSSLAVSIWQTSAFPTAAFYSPFSRAWELMVGALLALQPTVLDATSQAVRNVVSIAGALMIGVAITMFHPGMPFPGWWALLPMGAVLIIASGPRSVVNKVLMLPPLAGIGLISFPLYLWHWPLLSFARIINGGMPSVKTRSITLAAAFLLSWATYIFIEKYFRFGANKSGKAIALSVLMLALSTIGLSTYFASGLQFRRIASLTKIYADAANDWSYTPSTFVDGKIEGVHNFKGKSHDAVLFIGDSLMGQYYPRIEYLYGRAQTPEFSTEFISRNSCVPAPLTGFRSFPENINCDDYYDAAMKIAMRPEYKRIVLSGSWKTATDTLSSLGFAKMVNDIRNLVAMNKEVYLIGIPPHSPKFDPAVAAKALRNPFKTSAELDSQTVGVDEIDADDRTINLLLKSLSDKSGAVIIKPSETLCQDGNCPVIWDNHLTHLDAYHLTRSYSRSNSTFIDKLVFQ